MTTPESAPEPGRVKAGGWRDPQDEKWIESVASPEFELDAGSWARLLDGPMKNRVARSRQMSHPVQQMSRLISRCSDPNAPSTSQRLDAIVQWLCPLDRGDRDDDNRRPGTSRVPHDSLIVTAPGAEARRRVPPFHVVRPDDDNNQRGLHQFYESGGSRGYINRVSTTSRGVDNRVTTDRLSPSDGVKIVASDGFTIVVSDGVTTQKG